MSVCQEPGRAELVACSVATAVNRTEAALCGTGAVTSVAAAQGAIVAGGRAAVLLDTHNTNHTALGKGGIGAWVVHRRCCADSGNRTGFAFQLLATDAQQAVDHCLVAHRLAAHIGRPGLCELDPGLADELALVHVPTDAEGLKQVDVDGTAAGSVLAAAQEAFATVSSWTGRPCWPVLRHGPESARYVLVVVGAAWAQACAAAQLLSVDGVDCAVVGLTQLQPVPAEELRNAIGDADAVAVLQQTCSPDGLADVVRAAWQHDGEGLVLEVESPVEGPVENPGPGELAQALLQSFELPHRAPPAEATVQVPALALGAVPAGAWADGLLLEVATRLATAPGDDGNDHPGLVRLQIPEISTLSIGPAWHQRLPEQLDVLVVAHHSLLDLASAQHLRAGGAVLILSEAPCDGPIPALPMETRVAFQAAGIRVLWLPSAVTGPVDDDARLQYEAAAVLASCNQVFAREGLETARGATPTSDAESWLAGLEGVSALPEMGPVGDTTALPLMPEAPEVDAESAWIEAVRRFHVTGRGAVSAAEPVRGLPLRPWSLAPLLTEEAATNRYPAVVEGNDLLPFIDVARTGIDGIDGELLQQQKSRLAVAMTAHAGGGTPRALVDVYAEARTDFAASLDLSPAAATALTAELDELGTRLSPKAAVIGLGQDTLMVLLARAVAHARRDRIRTFQEDVRRLAQRLDERLSIDADLDGTRRTPDELSASLGGALQIDIPNLAKQLKVRRGSQRLGEPRRQRLTATLEHLRRFVDPDTQRLPHAVLLHPQHIDPGGIPDGITVVTHDVGMEAATGYFEASTRDLVELFRAVRTARLEVEDRYVPAHDAVLKRMDWQALEPEELAILPPVFVLESAERVRRDMSALSRLLRSGRPLHLIVLDRSAAMEAEANAAGLAVTHPDLGYLAVAHHDALVLQASLSLPGQLYDGLGLVADSLRPSVAVVSVPDWAGMTAPWAQLTAARYGRGTLDMLYNPDRGDRWSERFELASNPQSDELWPLVTVEALDGAGSRIEQSDAFTFAHAAAQSPRCRHAFRVIPTEAWTAEQLPIDEYLALATSARARRVPYLWVIANDGRLQRAVMTREMAYACGDRQRQWHTLQQLGGHRNEDVQRTEASVGHQAPHEAGIEALRQDVAREAIGKLVNALLSKDGAAMPAILAGVAGKGEILPPAVAADKPPAVEGPAAGQEPAAEQPAATPADEVELGEGYIDSPMCTSCHDCISMNPRMFQYDGNKQAILADASAGTYAQLVKAAEACPARCIIPGAPRDGDNTATPALIKRARKFS